MLNLIQHLTSIVCRIDPETSSGWHKMRKRFMIKKLLEQKKCFKLICGAGNENLAEVEKLVALYAKAGCRFFDLNASEEVLAAAQKGLDFAIEKEFQKDYHFCVSVGTKNDKHFKKARINSDKCKRCEQCIRVCPQKAINQYFIVEKYKCIGCSRCFDACKHGAMEIYSENKLIDLSTFQLPHLSCVELHVSDEESALAMWDELCGNFHPMMSICLARGVFSDEKTAELLKKMVAKRPPYTVVIKADGNPMSGGSDDFETTLPAVEMGKFVQSLNLPVYLLLSGGTNSKTAELAKLHAVNINGVSVGSFARKIVREYIEREDFLTNQQVFEEALAIAKNLINFFQV